MPLRERAAVPSARADRHLTVIRPRRGWGLLNLAELAAELWAFRDLLIILAVRDVKLRYRQTVLGVVWVVVQPLASALVFAVVFGRVARLPSEGVPYVVFSFAGLVGWNLFNSTLSRAGGSFLVNAHLVSKVYFPRIILPLSTTFSGLIDAGVAMAVLGVLLAWFRITPTSSLVFLPAWVLSILSLALGLGFIAAALVVRYRDVGFILPVAMQLLLFASPVAYSVSAVPENLRILYVLNPIAGLLEAFRWSFLGRGRPEWGSLAYAGAAGLICLATGVLFVRRSEREFADVI